MAGVDEKTVESRAIDLIQALVEHGGWYHSAIELRMGVDGEEAWDQALMILRDAGRPYKAVVSVSETVDRALVLRLECGHALTWHGRMDDERPPAVKCDACAAELTPRRS